MFNRLRSVLMARAPMVPALMAPVLIVIALLAAACTGSAAIEVTEAQHEPEAEPERVTVDAVEPTAESAEPTPIPATAEDQGETGAGDEDGDEGAGAGIPVTSPEAPLPSTWLCTVNVDVGEELNLRSGPSLDEAILFGIPGESCRMRVEVQAAGGWVGVRYVTQNHSIFGFVSTDFAIEDTRSTRAFNWFEQVVAEQDVSDLAEQELVDRSIGFHPFPPAAFELRPFDDGRPRPCQPIGPNTTGCPIHVLDSNEELVTPMVIELQEVDVNGEPEPKVTGFNLCIGTEDCPDFDFTLHGRIVIDDPGPALAGQIIGADAEEVIEALTYAFREPDEDTGWVVGCPLDGDLVNERYLSWGSLTAGFRIDEGQEYFNYWSYELDEDREPLPGGPHPSEVRLPRGIAVGMNISKAGSIVLSQPFENELLQLLHVNTGTFSFYGADLDINTRINMVAVPVIPICD